MAVLVVSVLIERVHGALSFLADAYYSLRLFNDSHSSTETQQTDVVLTAEYLVGIAAMIHLAFNACSERLDLNLSRGQRSDSRSELALTLVLKCAGESAEYFLAPRLNRHFINGININVTLIQSMYSSLTSSTSPFRFASYLLSPPFNSTRSSIALFF